MPAMSLEELKQLGANAGFAGDIGNRCSGNGIDSQSSGLSARGRNRRHCPSDFRRNLNDFRLINGMDRLINAIVG